MKSKYALPVVLAWFEASLFVAGCNTSSDISNTLTLATTTSTQESGLLDVLVPEFRRQSGIDVRVVAVGSGQALELGRRGDADVLLTHAPAAEEQFMDERWGEGRRPVMHNDFVLVGSESDRASVRGRMSILECFTRIADQEAPNLTANGTFRPGQEWPKRCEWQMRSRRIRSLTEPRS
jgi:tungstate transport system substrate-binding protein